MTDSQKQLATIVLNAGGAVLLIAALVSIQKDGNPPIDFAKKGKMWGAGLGLLAASYLLNPGQFQSKIVFNSTS